MPKIDTSNWGEFPLIELFDFYLSKGDNQAQKLDEGEIPLVSSGSFNNGICKYIDKGDGISELYDYGLITIDMFGQSFYQNKPFYAVSHGRVNILKPKFEINEQTGLFIASVMQKMYYEKYGFATMCSQTKLKKECIKLPINSQGNPDWQYMEEYMRNIEVRVRTSISKLESAQGVENSKIDVSSWGEFKLSDLFSVKTSKSVDKTYLSFDTNGKYDFIGRTSINNGVQGKLNQLHFEPNEAETYSVTQIGDNVCQYRENKWYSSQNIFILTPVNKKMNLANNFITTLITTTLKTVYGEDAYSSYPTLKTLPRMILKLPVDVNGEPDWLYMENYMKTLETKVNDFLNKTA